MEANIALYESLGFGETRREETGYGTRVHMEKPLP
jgi:ribosomal protein S18 acetylase RimI-like enzyme